MQAVGPKYEGEPTVEALANGLASLGRYGDAYMVHAAEGETVVPREVLEANPGLKNQLLWQMKMMGIENPNRYVVGSEFNSINPVTGQPEFFFKKIFKAVKKVFKKVLPIAAPIIGNMIAPGIGGPIAAALTAKLSGGSMSDALKSAAFTYGGQMLGSGIMGATGGGGMSGFVEGLQSGAMAPFQAAGNLFASGPTNPLQQGIFGNVNTATRGLNIDTIFPQYNPNAASAGVVGVPGAGTKVYGTGARGGLDLSAAGPSNSMQEALNIDAIESLGSGNTGVFGAAKDLIAEYPKTATAIALGAGAVGLGMLTPEEEAQFENLSPGDPRYSAYAKYKKLTPTEQKSDAGIALLKEAGIGPKYDSATLARITGITPEAAEQYQRNRYGFAVGPDMIGGGLAAGGAVNGPGTGTSDNIPAMLSDGEFVMTARAVDGAGGPAKMYRMMSEFEKRAGYG
jgi:hypothetical protein